MKITILGSGTSHGVPMIGCSCPVCRSQDPKNRRTRASIWIQSAAASVLVDTATDFRFQALEAGIAHLDAVFYTHAHADHLHGLDDLRSLCYGAPIPVYGNTDTIAELQERFSYIFRDTQKGGGKPRIVLNTIRDGRIEIGDLRVVPIPLKHGALSILGYRVGDAAYLTDCSEIPGAAYELLQGTRTLILGALRYRPHATHFSVSEALEAAVRIGADRTFFTHMCHDLEHEKLSGSLPAGIEPSYDGMVIETS